MRLLICIDDTDSKTSEKGTGAIAEELMKLVEDKFGAKTDVETSLKLLAPIAPFFTEEVYQYFGDESIHTTLWPEVYEELIESCYAHLKRESASESDPGLAVADIDVMDTELLIKYGKECKRKVVTIQSAYDTAEKAGIYLNEAGGTGQGVIGAVAGIGLRIWGYDGTLKGRPEKLRQEDYVRVSEICANPLVDRVVDTAYNDLPGDALVYLDKKPKVILYEGLLTIVVVSEENSGNWKLLEKNKARWLSGDLIFKEGCSEYKPDVDEERVDDTDGNCYNCLYRRWLENGILCQKPLQ